MVMSTIWLYSLVSVLVVSLISFIGVLTLSINSAKLKKFLIYLISFSAGTLFGDAFLHLLPELVEESGFSTQLGLSIIGGLILFFILEKIIHWRHCHGDVSEENHIHPFAYTNLVGDGVHNFLDGIIIVASYFVSVPAGIATTLAVVLHEIPQEIGDFGVLIHGGFSKAKALFLNFVSAFFAIIGAILTLLLQNQIAGLETYLVPIAIGGFIYIAGSDIIPELHKHSDKISKSILQLIAFVLGVAVMYGLLFLEI